MKNLLSSPKTSIAGILAGISFLAALSKQLGLLQGLLSPEAQHYVALVGGIAGAILIAAHGIVSQDSKPDAGAATDDTNKPNLSAVLLPFLAGALAIGTLCACVNGKYVGLANAPASQQRAAHAVANVFAVGVNLAESFLANSAANALEKKSQNQFLDSAAEAIRHTEALNVTGDDIYNAVLEATAGAKNNGDLAQAAAEAYDTHAATTGADATKESLAQGLQKAAATVRTGDSTK